PSRRSSDLAACGIGRLTVRFSQRRALHCGFFASCHTILISLGKLRNVSPANRRHRTWKWLGRFHLQINCRFLVLMKKKSIEFINMISVRGPGMWAYRPTVEAWGDIGGLDGYPSNTLPGLTERLGSWSAS